MDKYNNPTAKEINKFWSKVACSLSLDDCWLWQAATNGGYGWLRWNKNPTLAHRVVWEMVYGAIPDNLFVLHKCDNPPCVNPNHLWLGTHLDNNRDRAIKGRNSPRHGIHSFTRKLSVEQVTLIRERYALGDISTVKLAKEFGISQPHAHKIVTYQTWKTLT